MKEGTLSKYLKTQFYIYLYIYIYSCYICTTIYSNCMFDMKVLLSVSTLQLSLFTNYVTDFQEMVPYHRSGNTF